MGDEKNILFATCVTQKAVYNIHMLTIITISGLWRAILQSTLLFYLIDSFVLIHWNTTGPQYRWGTLFATANLDGQGNGVSSNEIHTRKIGNDD